jgi:ATP-dependent Clp protease, protease subunit
MLHHPSGVARGQASDIQNEARELMRVRNYVNGVLSQATGQSLAKVQHDFNRNKYFDTHEALEYGIIDTIIRPPRSQSLGV